MKPIKVLTSHILKVLLACLIIGCSDEFTPRPKGYLRIELPQKAYQSFDSICPFTFNYPVYAAIVPSAAKNAEPCWLNMSFSKFKGTLHLSYKSVNGNLEQLLDDTRKLTNKHIPKANAINRKAFSDKVNKVYGILYEIEGPEAASPIQFDLTDSTKNFIRGSLYFNSTPNNDSLAPVIGFIREDILQLMGSFRWKK
jgi:gliding motility-associated lipoprotein GldD